MTKQFDDRNKGVLFANDRRTQETDRDYSGSIDNNGDLRIRARDEVRCDDAELRINAEDIEDLLLALNDIWQTAQGSRGRS